MAAVLCKIQLNLFTTGTLGTETRVNVWIFCPPGRKKVAVVERWPLPEVRLYDHRYCCVTFKT